MNAILSETMQDTEFKIFYSFILFTVYSLRYGRFKYCQQLSKKYLVHVLLTIEMLVFILQLKFFSLKTL